MSLHILTKKSIKSLLAAILFLTVATSFSQKSQPLRVEIEAKNNSDNYNAIPLGKDGLMMFYQSDARTKGNEMWEFTKYNNNLKEDWTQEVPIPVSSTMIKYFLDPSSNTLYVLLGNIRRGTFQIVSMNTSTKATSTVSGKIPGKFAISDFVVENNKASIMCLTYPSGGARCLQACFMFTCIPEIFGTTVYKFKSFMVNDDLGTGNYTTVPLKYKGNTFVLNSDTINSKQPFVKIFVQNNPKKNVVQQYMIDYSDDGKLIKSTTLKASADKIIVSAKYEKLTDDEGIMIGTYGITKKAHLSFNPLPPSASISEGVFFSKFSKGEQDYIKFYPFTKFENFLSYLDKDMQAKVKSKQAKREKKGKEVSYNYCILTHKIIKKNNEYILIGEAYYPEYHQECYPVFDANGHSTMQCRQIFDGYRYTHAVVAGFNKEGELLWDNCFPIQDILTYNLKERVKVMHNGDDIILAYSHGGFIKSQIIQGDKVVQGKEETKIETNYTDDKVKQNWASDMDFWYDNYFLTWGYQRIKSDKANKGKRTVFYFNKIGLQ